MHAPEEGEVSLAKLSRPSDLFSCGLGAEGNRLSPRGHHGSASYSWEGSGGRVKLPRLLEPI